MLFLKHIDLLNGIYHSTYIFLDNQVSIDSDLRLQSETNRQSGSKATILPLEREFYIPSST